MITVLSPDTTVLYEAGAVEAMLGYRPSELEGRKLREWVHPEDVSSLLGLCASANGGGSARELRLFHRDGTVRTCEARATSLLDDELWNGIVLNVWDVSERKALEERLRHQAFHDGLTGLANRALFGDRLQHALARGRPQRRHGLGPAGRPRRLQVDQRQPRPRRRRSPAPARSPRAWTRGCAAPTRSPASAATSSPSSSTSRPRRLTTKRWPAADHRLARAPIELDGRGFPITASVGIARAGPGESSADRLVRDADLAMYSAKAKAKGSWAVYRPDMHIATEERLQLKADLIHALEDGGQLELYYQPVVALDGEGVVGLEALLRWNHPTRGQIAPETSSRSPRRPGRSCRSAAGCWIRPAARAPMGEGVRARPLDRGQPIVPPARPPRADRGGAQSPPNTGMPASDWSSRSQRRP